MPTLVISVLALASFVVHPESGDKVFFFLKRHFVPFNTELGIILGKIRKGNNGYHNDGDDGGLPHDGHP